MKMIHGPIRTCLTFANRIQLCQLEPFVGGGKHASHFKELVPGALGSAVPTSEL